VSWWQSKNGLTEGAKLSLAAIVGVALSCAVLYWVANAVFHGLFH
jgi:hypothetical protein